MMVGYPQKSLVLEEERRADDFSLSRDVMCISKQLPRSRDNN